MTLGQAITRIEASRRLRCVVGVHVLLEPTPDVRARVVAIRDVLNGIGRAAPLSTIAYLHRDDAGAERLTEKKSVQLVEWLSGPWRHERLMIELASAAGDVVGFRVAKQDPAPAIVYAAWPAAWAAERLPTIERAFLAIADRALAARCGAMVVEDKAWPAGVSLGELVRATTRAIADDPEWDLLGGDEHGLTSIGWWTVTRGGAPIQAGATPFGPAAADAQAQVFAELLPSLLPAILTCNIPEQERIARLDRTGLLRRTHELRAANYEAGQAACAAPDAPTWTRALNRVYATARELATLGLPLVDARGDRTCVHPAETRSLIPTALHRAPAGVDLAAHYARAWTELVDDPPARAALLATFQSLGPASRKQSWRETDTHRQLVLAGALLALDGDALEPYLSSAAQLADMHPVIHHALARLHAATGGRAKMQAHVDAAIRAGYEHAARLADDAALFPVVEPDLAFPRTLEPATVVFASASLILVHHETRGRFTFHPRDASCQKGDTVQIGGFDGVKARFLEVRGRMHEEW